jgi:hypothetical protein
LSATVSASLIFQSATRESTTSSAGAISAMAASAVSRSTLGPSSGAPRRKAISPSTRGATSLPRSIRAPSSSTICAVR